MAVDVGLINPIGLAGEALNYSRMLPDFAALEIQRRQIAVQSAQEQRLWAQQHAKDAELADYRRDVAEYEKDPTDDKMAQLMMKWPGFANENKISGDLRRDTKTRRAVERMGAVRDAMDNNPELATTLLEESISSAAAAGEQPDQLADTILADWRSGDPVRMNKAKGAVTMKMAEAMGPKEYYEQRSGKDWGALQKDTEFIESRQGAADASRFVERKIAGDPTVIFAGGQPVQVTPSTLPRYGGETPPPTGPSPTPMPQGKPFKTADGISGVVANDANGRPVVHSPQLAKPLRLVTTQQDYALVQPGEDYIATADGDVHTKPAQ